MNKIIKVCLAIVTLLMISSTIFGQRPPSFDPETSVIKTPLMICDHSDEVSNQFVPRSTKKSPYKNQALTLIPVYKEGVPQEIRDALEQSVFPLFSELFSSSVPIKIGVSWEQIGGGALAGAAPQSWYTNFVPHVRALNVFYPVALAEKIAGQQLNPVDSTDINVTIDSNVDWCLNCETQFEVGSKFDFTTVIFHELIHGFGYFSISDVTGGIGNQAISGGRTSIYNTFLELGNGDKTSDVQNGTVELGNHFTSNDLFFQLLSSGKPKLYAPFSYRAGSSVSHLDDVFNSSEHSLMTRALTRGKIERGAGISAEMLFDMGWVNTNMVHEERDRDIENSVDEDFVATFTIESDNGFDPASLKMHYSRDAFDSEDIEVMPTLVNGNTYQAIIPATGDIQIVNYYFELVDNRGLKFTSPGVNADNTQFNYQYAFGPDNIKPELLHTPVTFVKEVEPILNLSVNASDVFPGIDTVIIEWQINGNAQSPVGMTLDTSDFFADDKYIGTIDLPTTLNETDLLEYRIVATDASPLKNFDVSPETGFYEVDVLPISPSVSTYFNDFNLASDDFDGEGFSITQPGGFSNEAIHSMHPYPTAVSLGLSTINYTYELKAPIILEEAGKAVIEFDEIVLVEPGDPGTEFGDAEFWDYVIVEGKDLRGTEWKPLLDGYDSTSDPDWLSAYNSGIPNGGQDSGENGDFSMFETRTIDMLQSGDFTTGDTIFIRFRLFSDPLARGWGWAIDNLNIQDESTAVEDYVLNENFALIPNPASQDFTIALDLESTSDQILITIVDIMGKTVLIDNIRNPELKIRKKYSLDALADGIYFVNLAFNKKDIISKKLVVNK